MLASWHLIACELELLMIDLGGFWGSVEPERHYSTLTWAQNARNPFSEDLDFKIFWGEAPYTGDHILNPASRKSGIHPRENIWNDHEYYCCMFSLVLVQEYGYCDCVRLVPSKWTLAHHGNTSLSGKKSLDSYEMVVFSNQTHYTLINLNGTLANTTAILQHSYKWHSAMTLHVHVANLNTSI